jgi:Uma2 family endonuclease
MGTTSALMTVDEFLKLVELDERRLELFQGEVVDMASGGPVHETVKSNLNGIVRDWLKDHPIGKLYIETGYQIDNHSSLVPDLSVLSIERVKRGLQDLLRGAPDLAIEVVSSETAARLRTKVRLYLKHGSKAVWAVYPEERTLDIHSPNRQVITLEQDQVLEDHDTLPGFSTPVSAIFEGL